MCLNKENRLPCNGQQGGQKNNAAGALAVSKTGFLIHLSVLIRLNYEKESNWLLFGFGEFPQYFQPPVPGHP